MPSWQRLIRYTEPGESATHSGFVARCYDGWSDVDRDLVRAEPHPHAMPWLD